MSLPSLPQHILHRLALSKHFVREAKAKLQHPSDDLPLSLAVVNFHDGIDNLLGAVCSHLGVQLSDRAMLISTFEEISRLDPLPYKTEILQLNALRIDTKHKGLVPNPKMVLSLAPVLEQFCDYVCNKFFHRPLLQVSQVDAIEDANLRERTRQIERLIEAGKYRESLEAMAIVIFQEFDSQYVHEWESPFAAAFGIEQEAPEGQRQVFPRPKPDTAHRIFLEMGIEPDLYYRFHNIVPQVGYDNLRDMKLIIKKDRSTWHFQNWSLENSLFCFDFLINFLIRRQKGYQGFTIIHKYFVDKIEFVRDSTVYDDMQGSVAFKKKAGECIVGEVYDYVDGAWQGDQDNPLTSVLISGNASESSRFLYVRKEDVKVFPDQESKYLDLANFAKRKGSS